MAKSKVESGKPRALYEGAAKARYHHGDLRAVLLEAAEAELSEKSIENFSLRGVAKRAGVSHAAPAHHFGDVDGLLTALAAIGHRRFVALQNVRQKRAVKEGAAQLVAAGLGYIDFAMTNPALFRLMFSSKRPDFCQGELAEAATIAFEKLLDDVGRYRNGDPREDDGVMADAMSTWAMVHGLADLLNGGRMKFLQNLPRKRREELLADMILRAASPG
ncbi:TetR/AcrR family transcriptional regulator [Pelagibius sp. Alg239-R121]|uniref:TetR/AcrR family transcriptional regulator n=1 Tax=Pelagibius sp. Alg239-R121 TaxID=2993448 RepID=UPI0024A67651|nr:TetR/AcrR family transcriptional regulator [Pelagibius sp. Alg239-R121]